MSLSGLATVELQLIMHACDRVSLLTLAHCSRTTLTAASSPFAWQSLSPVCFDSTVPDLGRKVASSLLRHSSIALRWLASGPRIGADPLAGAPTADEFDALTSVTRVVTLDAGRRYDVRPEDWQTLLAHPSLHGLTSLSLTRRSLQSVVAELIVHHLPRLQTLRVGPDPIPAMRPVPFFTLLAERATALRELRISDHASLRSEALASVGRCSQLRHLALRYIRPHAWLPLLASAGMRQLTELTMEFVHADHGRGECSLPETIDWTSCFANLTLSRLTLHTVFGVDTLLAALLPHACTLRCLRIMHERPPQSGGMLSAAAWGSTVPTVDSLQRLTDAWPMLSIELIMPRCAQLDQQTRELAMERWRQVNHQFADWLQSTRPRTCLLLRDVETAV